MRDAQKEKMKARIKCLECHTTLWSKKPRDFQKCDCENGAFVDLMVGGNWRVGAKDISKILVLDHGQKMEQEQMQFHEFYKLRYSEGVGIKKEKEGTYSVKITIYGDNYEFRKVAILNGIAGENVGQALERARDILNSKKIKSIKAATEKEEKAWNKLKGN